MDVRSWWSVSEEKRDQSAGAQMRCNSYCLSSEGRLSLCGSKEQVDADVPAIRDMGKRKARDRQLVDPFSFFAVPTTCRVSLATVRVHLPHFLPCSFSLQIIDCKERFGELF